MGWGAHGQLSLSTKNRNFMKALLKPSFKRKFQIGQKLDKKGFLVGVCYLWTIPRKAVPACGSAMPNGKQLQAHSWTLCYLFERDSSLNTVRSFFFAFNLPRGTQAYPILRLRYIWSLGSALNICPLKGVNVSQHVPQATLIIFHFYQKNNSVVVA